MFGIKRCMAQSVLLLLWLLEYWTFNNAVIKTIIECTLCVAVFLAIMTYDYDYWVSRGVFAPPALPIVGHMLPVVLLKEQGGLCFKRFYDLYKKKRFFGTHQCYQRTLVVCDPELIKRMCVNDFNHFVDRGFFFNEDVDPLAGSVLYLRGNEWKRLRAKISPIFSPNKLRSMYPIIDNTAKEFLTRVTALINTNSDFEGEHAEVKCEKLVGGYTADAIVPCAFGIKSNVMDNENDPFAVALHAFYEMTPYNIFLKTMQQFWPAFVLFFRMRIIPKKTHDFFTNIVTSVLRAREGGTQEKRGDFIDLMMALRSDNNNNGKLDGDDVQITDMVISANAFIIFLGGFETTSATLAFLFLELAVNPQVQETLRAEIIEVMDKHDGKVSYEVLQELTYMEMVIQETLRLYPPFPTIQRMCTKDYNIPGSDVVVQKGTTILFPILGLQRDEQYFERPLEFIPERWAENRTPPPQGVFTPFGIGPRYCIGKRFAMIQMKCCLVRLLRHARLEPARTSKRAEPFAADPRSPLTLHPADSLVKISLL